MKVRTALLMMVSAALIFVISKTVFSQDTTPTETAQPAENTQEVVQGGAVPAETAKPEPETQWVWGEVVNVDAQNKTISVKYLDYESDQEKEMTVGADDKTTFENAASLDELKAKDTVSIDYITQDGKNIAKNISVEKPEAQPVAPQTQTETSVPAMPQASAPATPAAAQTETKPEEAATTTQAPAAEQPSAQAPSGN